MGTGRDEYLPDPHRGADGEPAYHEELRWREEWERPASEATSEGESDAAGE